MNAFTYIVTEGVHDVAFIGRLLVLAHGANRINKLEELDEALRGWLANAFKWPRFTGKHHDIARMAVPAPVFYRGAGGGVVALRNAQGITEIGNVLSVDKEAFARAEIRPGTIGVVLDSDDEAEEQRFGKMKQILERLDLHPPIEVATVSDGDPRVGIFALPEQGVAGTLEDILLTLGETAYPELAAAARGYADEWRRKVAAEPDIADWKELRKPAGGKKAAIGAMTALLKPGKSTQVSLEDNRWVSEQTQALACLQPCLKFLNSLLEASPDPGERAATVGEGAA